MTPAHKQEIERVKEQAMRAFGHVEGVSMEDALATMVLMLEHHTAERNEALDLNTRRANQLAQAWRAADDAEKRAIELLQGMKG
jgi:hypothetical protein